MVSVTVIVPAYNAESTLDRCVESILAQEGIDLELVIVDDGSDDGTAQAIDRFAEDDTRVKAIHQANAGRCVARNAGIEAAQGEWLFFCDADDWLIPGSLAAMADLIDEGACAIWAGYANAHNVRSSSDCAETLVCRLDRGALLRKIIKGNVSVANLGGFSFDADGLAERSAWAKLLRRSLFEGDGSVRFREGIRLGEDALFNAEFLASVSGYVIITTRIVYYYDLVVGGTVLGFDETDALSLVPFCRAVDSALVPLGVRGDYGLEVSDVVDFAGRGVASTLRKAARFAPSLSAAGVQFGRVMKVACVRNAWENMRPEHARYEYLRRVMLFFIDLGYPAVALALYRSLLRVKGELPLFGSMGG